MMFSIVIPTRARPDTLRHALRTVLAQTDGDFEVIVHESGDDPATAATVAEFDDPRVRFFKTGEPMRMTENWERALAHVRGDYVLFIGDDDGLLPDACAIAREILNAKPYAFLDNAPLEERRTQAVYTRRASESSTDRELGILDANAAQDSSRVHS